MSKPASWNHLLCKPCYRLLTGNGAAVRHTRSDLLPEQLQCCHCGAPARDIWLRMDPKEMNCEGEGGVHEVE